MSEFSLEGRVADVDRLMETALDEFGTIDVLAIAASRGDRTADR